MVVDYPSMSSVNFAIPDFCSLIPNVPALAGNFQAGLPLEEAACGELLLHNDLFLKN
jgi:hypothetical protein